MTLDTAPFLSDEQNHEVKFFPYCESNCCKTPSRAPVSRPYLLTVSILVTVLIVAELVSPLFKYILTSSAPFSEGVRYEIATPPQPTTGAMICSWGNPTTILNVHGIISYIVSSLLPLHSQIIEANFCHISW
jgi:hypothetical protein